MMYSETTFSITLYKYHSAVCRINCTYKFFTFNIILVINFSRTHCAQKINFRIKISVKKWLDASFVIGVKALYICVFNECISELILFSKVQHGPLKIQQLQAKRKTYRFVCANIVITVINYRNNPT